MTFWSGPWDAKGATPAVPMRESEWRSLMNSDADGFVSVGGLTLSDSNGDVTLSGARGRVQGAAFIQTGSDTVTLTAVPGGQQRIDYVVLRYNPSNNSVSLQTVIGTPAVTNTVEPLLEPQKSGSSLFTGPYDIPVARFTGAAGTAAQRGIDMRLRTSRLFFIPDAIRSFSTINERRGDIRFSPSRAEWYDSTAGQWKTIGLPSVLRKGVTANNPIAAGDTELLGTMGTSFSEGSWSGGGGSHSSQWIAPHEGLYRVNCQVFVERTDTGQSGHVHLQLRQGVAAGSGSPSSGLLIRETPEPISGVRMNVQLNDLVYLGEQTRYHFALLNTSSQAVVVEGTTGRSFYTIEYVRPHP